MDATKKISQSNFSTLIGQYLCNPPLGEEECKILSLAKNRENASSNQQQVADI